MPPKKRRMTQREKALNAKVRKQLKEDGILPPDKPRLNRKKFAKEVNNEWNATEGPLYAYVMSALGWMIAGTEIHRSVTPEQIGALKVLKIALEIKKFEDALPEGTTKYSHVELYEKVISPIIEL